MREVKVSFGCGPTMALNPPMEPPHVPHHTTPHLSWEGRQPSPPGRPLRAPSSGCRLTHTAARGGRTDGHHLRQSCPVGRGEGAGESSRTAVAASPSCELTREVDHHAVREKQFTIAGDSIRSASESRHHASGGVGRGLSAAVTPTYDAAVAGGHRRWAPRRDDGWKACSMPKQTNSRRSEGEHCAPYNPPWLHRVSHCRPYLLRLGRSQRDRPDRGIVRKLHTTSIGPKFEELPNTRELSNELWSKARLGVLREF